MHLRHHPNGAWETAVRCHPGRHREINEDAYLARPDLGLWAVADGMGGHTAGDVASRTVVSQLDRVPASDTLEALVGRVRGAVRRAHEQVLAESARRGHQTIGTTVAILAAMGQRGAALWAGDSRIYLHRDGLLRQLSVDHNVAQERVAEGQLSPTQAEASPDMNVLTRALGMDGALILDETEIATQAGDVLLLCSDGLNKELSDEDMERILSGADTLEHKAQRLLDESLERGGRDNITLVLVHRLPIHEP